MVIRTAVLALCGSVLLASAAQADDCPLCARSVVTTRDLASCFLDKYGSATPSGTVLAVDLSGCENRRSIVQALPAPGKTLGRPDTRFLISPAQLTCLKRKLADPALVLDPQARIELDSCE